MRWPWSRAIPAGAAQPPGGPVAAARGEAGWAYLPPLQRTIVDAPRITAPHDLAAWRSPAFTGRMSHAVSPAAPCGIVDADGLGVPSTQAPALDLPLLIPPHEAPAPVAQRTADAAAAPETLVPRLPEARVITPALAVPSLTVSRAVEVPMPTARAIAAEPIATTLAHSMSQHETPAPAPPVADAAVLGEELPPSALADGMLLHDNGGATEVTLPRPAHLPTVGTPLATPPQRPTVAETSRGLPAVQRAAEPQATRSAAPRRLGLGAPLPSLPVAQRAVPETPVTSAVADAAAAAAESPHAPAVAVERPAPAAPPVLPVQRAAAAEVAVAHPADLPAAPEQTHPAEVPVLGERLAEPAAGITAPITAPVTTGEPVAIPGLPAAALPLAEPVRETAPAAPPATPAVQREPDPAEPVVRPSAPAMAVGPVAVAPPVQRVAGLLSARTVPLHLSPSLTPSPPRARTAAQGTVTVQRAVLLPPPAPSPASAPPAQHLLSARAVVPEPVPEPAAAPPVPAATPSDLAAPLPIQRLLDSAPPPPSPYPAAAPAPAVLPTPASHRDQLRLPVAMRPQSAVDQAGTVATLQREAAADAPEPAGDLAPEAEPEPAPSTAQGAATSAAPALPAAAASSPEELDKLAARLLEPLTRRIKAEMIIDRERRGLRSDPR